jgi:hypothetical protein
MSRPYGKTTAQYRNQRSYDRRPRSRTTLQSKADLTGLTPGSTSSFRIRPMRKTGEAAWTQTVSWLVAQVGKTKPDVGRSAGDLGSSSP